MHGATMNKRAYRVFVVSVLWAIAAHPGCSPAGGCGPDNNLERQDFGYHKFVVPPGSRGRVTFTTEAECEQAVVFYNDSFGRIGRLGTHENDSGGDNMLANGRPPGTFHVGGYMKFADRWRTSDHHVREQDSSHLVLGWDDIDCRGHIPDGDYNDIILT